MSIARTAYTWFAVNLRPSDLAFLMMSVADAFGIERMTSDLVGVALVVFFGMVGITLFTPPPVNIPALVAAISLRATTH